MRSLHPWPFFPASLPPQAAASLSLQFLIQELLFTFDWLDDMQTKVQPTIDQICSELRKFLPHCLEDPLSQKGGFLDKLCFYINILSKHSSTSQDKIFRQRLNTLSSLTLELYGKIFALKMPTQSILEEWSAFIHETKQHLHQLFSDLFSYLQEFSHDENLLFLLIEQKDPLNQYLGHQAIETILARLFPQGPSSLREILYNGYARRGFLDFYARHEKLIESIDWEDLCSTHTKTT